MDCRNFDDSCVNRRQPRRTFSLPRILMTLWTVLGLFIAAVVMIPTKSAQAQSSDLFRSKHATASGTYQWYAPSRAVDGDSSSDWHGGGDVPRWWSVDAESLVRLGSVRIKWSNMVDFTVQGSTDNSTWSDLASYSGASNGDTTFSIGSTISYRFFRIYITEVASAIGTSLFTVEGYGTVEPTPTPLPNDGIDRFQSKYAVANGSYQGHVPTNAVDGNANSLWHGTSALPRWWSVDVESSIRLSSMRMVQRQTGTSENILDFTLQGSNDNTTWNDLLSVTNAVGGTVHYNVGSTAAYRFYRIYVTRVPAGSSGTTLFTVEGYGTVEPTPTPLPNDGIDRFRSKPAISSGSYQGHVPTNAVDGNANSLWHGTSALPRWWSVDTQANIRLSSMRMVQRQTGTSENILDFTLQGSNDNTTWNDLLSVTNAVGGTVHYNVGATAAYRYYRIYITRVPAGSSGTTVFTVEGYGVVLGSLAPRLKEASYGPGGCGVPESEQTDHGKACGFGLDPVNMATGNFVWQHTDLAVAAPGTAFNWQRTYNSLDTRVGMLGRGWSGTYDARLDLSVTGKVKVIVEGGGQSIYTLQSGQYLPPPGERARLTRNADGTYLLVRPNQYHLRFSSTGQLLSKSDSAGRTVTLNYTAGQLSSITDAVGRVFNISTDAQGHVKQITDTSVQRSVVYTYTGDLLTDVKDVLGQITHYDYASNLLTSITLPDGTVRVQNQYDTAGRTIWQDAWNTAPYTVTYDLVAPSLPDNEPLKRTQVQDSNGQTMAYDHDVAGRLARVIDANGHSTVFSRDFNDGPTSIVDGLGHITSQTFDDVGNVLVQTDATNRRWQYTYDSGNRLRTEQDELGHTTTYTYTAEGLLKQAANALGHTTTYTYTSVLLSTGSNTPLLTASEDALGRLTRAEYNNLGQPVVITNALNQVSHLEYDAAGRLTRSIDPAGIATCNEYDAADNLMATVANCVAGQPSTINQNVRTEYGYDVLGRGIWNRNSLGEVTRTFYNEKGQVSKVVVGCALNGTASTGTCDAFDPTKPELNRTTTYGYDELGRQVSVTDMLGVVTHTGYDTLDRPDVFTSNYIPGQPADAVRNVAYTTEYDDAGRVNATIDPLGRRSVPHYDNAGRVIEQITNYVDGNPSTGTADTDLISRTDYDVVGLPVTTTINYVDGVWDPLKPDEDLRSVTQYDALGRPSKIISNYVDGVSGTNETDTDRITEYRYDAVGNLVVTVDPLGRVDVTIFDALNRPTTQIRNCTDGNGVARTSDCATGHGADNDENIRTSNTYNVRGFVETSRDALNRIAHTSYDQLGRTTEQVWNEDGVMVPTNVRYRYETIYTSIGYTSVVTDPLNAVTKREYNRAGWLVKQIDATNRAVTYQYDGLGRLTVVKDALGHETRTIYDALGRTHKQVANWQNGVVDANDPSDADLTHETVYDAASRRVASIGTDGRRTNYNYDNLDRLISVVENANGSTVPSNVTTSYSYSRRGMLTGITDAEQHARSFGYNAAGWMVSEKDGLNRTTTYTYDKAGRTLTKADPRPVTITNAYDKADRLKSVSASGLTTISYAYDVQGRRTSMVDETGTTTYTYNGLDNLTDAAHSVDGTVSYGYDLVGRRTSITSSQSGAPYVAYEYDAAGRLENVKQATGAGQPQSLVAHADYDAVGRLQTVERANGATTAYGYDGADRLTSLATTTGQGQGATTVADFSYTLNRLGQVTSVSEAIGQSSRSVSYTYDGLYRLTQAVEQPGTTYGYTYDLVGNRTQVTENGTVVESRTYDAAGQVSGTGWQYDGAGNLLADGTNTYSYNALRQLTNVTSNGAGGVTEYAYNGDGVLTAKQRGTNTTRYILDAAGSLSERLGQVSVESGQSTWYVRGWQQELSRVSATDGTEWYLSDKLGSVRAILNGAGQASTTYNYEPFGTPEGTNVPQDYGFTGEPQDASTNLVQLRARWYNPAASRFQTVDPFFGFSEEPMSRHPYLYVFNDPINNTDPTGLSHICIWPCLDPGESIEDRLCWRWGILCDEPEEKGSEFGWDRLVRGSQVLVDACKTFLIENPESIQSWAESTYVEGIGIRPVKPGITNGKKMVPDGPGGGARWRPKNFVVKKKATNESWSDPYGSKASPNHKEDLAYDPDQGRPKPDEGVTAVQLEDQLGKRLERNDPINSGKSGDWTDKFDTTYDKVCCEASRLAEHLNNGSIRNAISDHLQRQGLDYLVFDVTNLTPAQRNLLDSYLESPMFFDHERAKFIRIPPK